MGKLKSYLIGAGMVLLFFFLGVVLIDTILIPVRESKKHAPTVDLLAELTGALERYQIDRGIFPFHLGPAEQGGVILYEALTSADRNYIDSQTSSANSKIIQGKLTFVDKWGDPICYQCDLPTVSPKERKTFNPTYDLWSTAGAKGDSVAERINWITNWQSH